MTTMPVDKSFFVVSGFGARNGGTHWGVDFGKEGGSGGQPVYAARRGTVVYAGPAGGFGGPDPAGWVVVDSPDGGTQVYGHVIREVTVGDEVSEGQRIARINPDTRTNGGTPDKPIAPHLHFEWHRYVWVGPGPDRLDPMVQLAGARWPGDPQPPSRETNVIHGVDISNYQDGFSCRKAAAEGYQFAFIKASEGTWRDPIFRSHLDDARAAGMLVAAYHYVHSGASAPAQARAFADHVGDTTVPCLLDAEANSGSADFVRAVAAEIRALGYRVALTYLPRWYWQQIGSPSLAGLPPLWTSNYGTVRADWTGPGWDGYGGLEVAVWQHTDSALIAGRRADANIFRGTKSDLAALLTGTTPADTQEDDMTPEQDRMLREVHRELTQLYPSRSAYRVDNTPVDTLAGLVLNVDARIHEQWVEAKAKAEGVTPSVIAQRLRDLVKGGKR